MRRALALALIGLATASLAQTPPPAPTGEVISIWPDGAPGAGAHRHEPEQIVNSYVHHVEDPTLTLFAPAPGHANGAAIILAPGGGHQFLVWQNEGVLPALTLRRYGIAVFVLKYRLAREPGSPYAVADAIEDARQAVRWVRGHAAHYHVDPHRIGLMGFSAGGELVTGVADDAPPAGSNPAGQPSARPDFQILAYPGPLGIPANAVKDAPPAFLTAGTLDPCCAEPAITLYQQLRGAGVSAQLMLWADIGHGFNVGSKTERLSIAHWPDLLVDWMSDEGFLAPGDRNAASRCPDQGSTA